MVRVSKGKQKGLYYEFEGRTEGLQDPYISRKGLKEPTICPSCHAVYHKKRWYLDEALYLETKKKKNVNWQKCPADRKIEDRYPMGIVNIYGGFVKERRDEIISLLRSEERHALEKNPLERLMRIERRENGLYVETTTDSLAMRIGHCLSSAYKGGETKFDWKVGDRSLIVQWGREK